VLLDIDALRNRDSVPSSDAGGVDKHVSTYLRNYPEDLVELCHHARHLRGDVHPIPTGHCCL
jgi:hypothetical protein